MTLVLAGNNNSAKKNIDFHCSRWWYACMYAMLSRLHQRESNGKISRVDVDFASTGYRTEYCYTLHGLAFCSCVALLLLTQFSMNFFTWTRQHSTVDSLLCISVRFFFLPLIYQVHITSTVLFRFMFLFCCTFFPFFRRFFRPFYEFIDLTTLTHITIFVVIGNFLSLKYCHL